MVYKLTADNFQQEVLNSDIPVLVDFYADWCGPCKMMAPVIETLSEISDLKIKYAKINIDDNSSLAAQYRVMSIPTFILFKNGQAVETIMGARSQSELENQLKQII